VTKNGFNSLKLGNFGYCHRLLRIIVRLNQTLSDVSENVGLFENKRFMALSKKLGEIEFTLESWSEFELWISQPRNLCFYGR
jgi:hypothetical protein